MDEASLNKLKIGELKDKCKKLSIAGFSRLAKSQLVAKILAASSSTAAASSSHRTGRTSTSTNDASGPPQLTSPSPPSPELDNSPAPTPSSSRISSTAKSVASTSVSKSATKRPRADAAAEGRMSPPTSRAPPTASNKHKADGGTSVKRSESTLASSSASHGPPKTAHTASPQSRPTLPTTNVRAQAALASVARTTTSASSSHQSFGAIAPRRTAIKFVSPLFGPPAGPNRPKATARPRPLPLPSHRLPPPTPSHLPLTLKAIQSSWLARMYRSLHLSHPASPDSFAFDAIAQGLYDGEQKALQVAMRFVLARFGRELMLCGMMDETSEASGLEGGREGGWGVVVGLERMGGEVWRVDVARSGERKGKQKEKEKETRDSAEEQESWLVLGTTGEPLGLAASATPTAFLSSTARHTYSSSSSSPPLIAAPTLRSDWSTYTDFILSSASASTLPPRLSSLIQTPNSAEYPSGISKTWWESPTGGDQGRSEEGKIAERYVLASCIVQGTSGEYQTAQKQCDLFAGIVSTASTFATLNSHLAPTARTLSSSPFIQLFLPLYALSINLCLFLPLFPTTHLDLIISSSSSHITSLHLLTNTTASLSSPLVPLHPSLALVVKEENADAVEYILRETGQIVGAGEEGVGEVSREVLRCDERGIEVEAGR